MTVLENVEPVKHILLVVQLPNTNFHFPWRPQQCIRKNDVILCAKCSFSSNFPFPLFNQKKKKRSVCACCPTSMRKVEWDGLISSFLSSRDRHFWRDVLDSACKTVCVYLFLLIHFRCVWLHPVSPSPVQ
jgi:hypothetical protein